jgi:HPr kinase/phosphorylase
MSIFNVGTLLTGESGIGKSELALALINRGHQLVADDAPEFFSSGDFLTGRAPFALKNLLEIRGIGIFNIPALFGPAAIVQEQTLSLVIQLTDISPLPRVPGNPLLETKPILNMPIPHTILPAARLRRSELLVETLVRHYKLQQSGATPTLSHPAAAASA